MNRSKTAVTVVCGPPGAGKSTYVRESMNSGDLVIDLDEITAALSLQPIHYDTPASILTFAWEARDAILDRLMRENSCRQAWIIDCAPEAERRNALRERFMARVLVLTTPADVCKDRVSQRTNADTSIVSKWWSDYRADPADEILASSYLHPLREEANLSMESIG